MSATADEHDLTTTIPYADDNFESSAHICAGSSNSFSSNIPQTECDYSDTLTERDANSAYSRVKRTGNDSPRARASRDESVLLESDIQVDVRTDSRKSSAGQKEQSSHHL